MPATIGGTNVLLFVLEILIVLLEAVPFVQGDEVVIIALLCDTLWASVP